MTRHGALYAFRRDVLPALTAEHEPDGRVNVAARAQAWAAFVTGLYARNQISRYQVLHWPVPQELYALRATAKALRAARRRKGR